MALIPKFVPTPIGMVPKPPVKKTAVAAYTPAVVAGSNSGGAAPGGGGLASSGGGSSSGYRAAAGYNKIDNPWEAAMKANYEAAQGRPFQGEWQQGVAQAMTLGNRDYEGDLRRFAQEDVQKQVTRADNQLGSLGMRELALRPDVQADRAKAFSDASTRAAIDAQGMKANALETMRGMLGSATGVELDRIGKMIQAAGEGGSNYNQFSALAIPLQERLGMGSAPTPSDSSAADEAARAVVEQTARNQAIAEARRLAPLGRSWAPGETWTSNYIPGGTFKKGVF